MDYSNLFQYFYWCAMVPTLVENSKFFHVLVSNSCNMGMSDSSDIYTQVQGL